MTRVAHAGVGGWGKNVVRVVGELADLTWICDTDGARLAEYTTRYPSAHTTATHEDVKQIVRLFPYTSLSHR